MERIIIRQFDPVIYPFKLWITITNNLKDLKNLFVDNKGERLKGNLNDCKARTCNVCLKENINSKGILIIFTDKEYLTAKIIAHEAYHCSVSMWNYIEETYPSEEATAYLIGWIADCINNLKIDNGEDKNY